MAAVKTQAKLSWGRILRIALLVVIVGWTIARLAFPDRPTLFAGLRPDTAIDRAGLLTPCPSTPNCVSSQSPEGDEHYIAPLAFLGEETEARSQLKTLLQNWPGAKIVEESDRYLSAEFTSRWMGFVDDVEFVLSDRKHQIDVRSASRQGESDLGVNRKRIESLRSRLQETLGNQ